MSQFVTLNFGKGDWQHGFPIVIAQIGKTGRSTALQMTGSLPPAPQLPELCQHWRQLYKALSERLRLRRTRNFPAIEFEEDPDEVSNISLGEFHELCQQLEQQINRWLNAESFRKIYQQLCIQLSPSEEIQVVIEVEDEQLRRFPWHLWHFFEDYPQAEFALSPLEYEKVQPIPSKGRILAVLGNASGIDVQRDRALLEHLPGVETVFLVEPQREELDRLLWDDRGWDILFFAGHSSSFADGRTGQIEINPQESLTILHLKNALRAAIARGLKLAIFNSCDGLGLAKQLADINLPQLIVMREPVPDRVAQEFLKNFLGAFSRGQSFYLAVREARERLQGLESNFPCASWLPTICQNPTTTLPCWQKLCAVAPPPPAVKSRPPLSRRKALGIGIGAMGLVLGARLLGLLQPLELTSFDALLRLRPKESPDERLLLITITGKDVQAQPPTERKSGSLSNRSLEQLLEKLNRYQPRAIGLDIYRSFPIEPEFRSAIARFETDDRLIAVCKVADDANNPGIPPPTEIPPDRLSERVGFSDLVTDADGVLRRQLFGLAPPINSPCQTSVSLSLQLALRYLKEDGIEARLTPQQEVQVGKVILHTLGPNSGGYHRIDAEGYQMLLNYRATPEIAPKLTLEEALSEDGLTADLVSDRIVLIGTVDRNFEDFHRTPYDRNHNEKTPGVVVQAHMTSQILSAVQDGRALLWVLPQWAEILWIVAWGAVAGAIGWPMRSRLAIAIAGSATLILLSGCYAVLLWRSGVWLPWVPSGFAVIAANGTVAMYKRLI